MFQRKGGVSGGAERKKTKTDSGQDAGRQSGQTEPEHGGTAAGEESAALPFLAGGRGKKRMEADGEAVGAARNPDGDRHIGHTCVFGFAPNFVGQLQNIFVFVDSSA